VHGATDAAHYFRISGLVLELERLVVEGLQNFLRTLKEQFP
jgi:hypothetical protein